VPFTLSHAVAALPFLRTQLPVAALVIGTMTPDLPYFLPVGIPREFSHSLLGVITIDLLVGIAVLLAWIFVLRAPLLDYSPAWLRERMPRRVPTRTPKALALTLLALIIGSLTHLALDAITHQGSLDALLPVMATKVGTGITVANVVHIVISLVGAAILAVWVRRWVQRTPRTRTSTLVADAERGGWWLTLGIAFVLLFLLIWGYNISLGSHFLEQHALFVSFVAPTGIFGAVAVLICLAWHVRRARRQSRELAT
jgi:hypothetical protein